MKKKLILLAGAVFLLTSCRSSNGEIDIEYTVYCILGIIVAIFFIVGWIGEGSDDY